MEGANHEGHLASGGGRLGNREVVVAVEVVAEETGIAGGGQCDRAVEGQVEAGGRAVTG